jgi:hypothetical protein
MRRHYPAYRPVEKFVPMRQAIIRSLVHVAVAFAISYSVGKLVFALTGSVFGDGVTEGMVFMWLYGALDEVWSGVGYNLYERLVRRSRSMSAGDGAD